jgi:hypothetical protein
MNAIRQTATLRRAPAPLAAAGAGRLPGAAVGRSPRFTFLEIGLPRTIPSPGPALSSKAPGPRDSQKAGGGQRSHFTTEGPRHTVVSRTGEGQPLTLADARGCTAQSATARGTLQRARFGCGRKSGRPGHARGDGGSPSLCRRLGERQQMSSSARAAGSGFAGSSHICWRSPGGRRRTSSRSHNRIPPRGELCQQRAAAIGVAPGSPFNPFPALPVKKGRQYGPTSPDVKSSPSLCRQSAQCGLPAFFL